MAWLETPKACRKTCLPRQGSLLVEAVVSMLLLTTATVALTRLARSAATLSQQSDQRLAATLAAENVLDRLRETPYAQLAENASVAGTSVAEQSGCAVIVVSEPFRAADGIDGIHLWVQATVSPSIGVTLHDWRLRQKESEAEESDGNP